MKRSKDQRKTFRIRPMTAAERNRPGATGSVLLYRPTRYPNGDPPDVTDPPIVADPPDLAVQMSIPVTECPREEGLSSLTQAVAAMFAQALFASPEVMADCENGNLVVALWAEPSTRTEVTTARQLAMKNLELLDGQDTFGLFINQTFIRLAAQIEFAQMPKRYQANGLVNRNGPIHLESLSVELDAPASVITRVRGYDDRPWPDIHFTQIMTDELSRGDSIDILCDDSTLRLAPVACDSSMDNVVDEGDRWRAATIAFAVGPIAPLSGYLVSQLAAAANTSGSGTARGGVGAVLANLANTPVPLPIDDDGIKRNLVVTYTSAAVDPSGVFFLGTFLRCRREPQVSIVGPRHIEAYAEDQEIKVPYSASITNSVGEIAALWNVTGGAAETPTGLSTLIVFGLTSGALQKKITFTCSDAEGPLPTVTIDVTIELSAKPPNGIGDRYSAL